MLREELRALEERVGRAARGLASDLRKDAARYEMLGGWHRNAGFYAGACYRVGCFARRLPRPMRVAVRVPQGVVDKVIRGSMNVRISADARIGPGLCLIHAWNVMIGPGVIGENALVFHEVTIGSNDSTPDSFPILGDNVHVYAGAKVLGAIQVGDDANVGANCVVTSSVPRGASVVTASTRVVPAAVVAAFGVRKPPAPAPAPPVVPTPPAPAPAATPAAPPSTTLSA